MENTEKEKRPERALLAAVDTGEYDAEASLAELYELVRSAGGGTLRCDDPKEALP